MSIKLHIHVIYIHKLHIYIYIYLCFPGGTVVKNLSVSVGDKRDVGLIPGLERSSGAGNGSLRRYSCLGNPMDRGACWATVHGVEKSRT